MPAYDLPRIMAHPSAPRVEPPQSTPQYAESPATSPDDPPLTFDLALDDEDDAAIPRPVDRPADFGPIRMDDVPDLDDAPIYDGVRAPHRPLMLVARTAGYLLYDTINELGTLRVISCYATTYRFGVTWSDDVDMDGCDESALIGARWRYWTEDYTGHSVDLAKPAVYHQPLIDAIREHVAIVEA